MRLAFSDATSKEFFERFSCSGVAAAAVAAAAPAAKSRKGAGNRPPAVPDTTEWRPFQGSNVAFSINFPGVTPQPEDPLGLFPEEQARQFAQKQWAQAEATAESFSAQVGDRKYGVTAWRNGNSRNEGSIRFDAELQRRTRDFVGGIYKKVRSRGLTQPTSAARSLKILTTSLALRGGGKAVVREARTGNYCFVLRVEGPATMDDLDPQLQKFLDSLSPPPDAAPSAD